MKKTNNILIVIMLISCLFICIGYAKITDTTLNIEGAIKATAQSGVFISDVKAALEDELTVQKINYYEGTLLSSTVQLSNSLTSSVTYEISIYNNSSEKKFFKGVVYDDVAYSNKNIIFELSGIEPYVTTIGAKKLITFNITFKYAPGITVISSPVLKSLLNFSFSNEIMQFTLAGEKYAAPTGITWEQFIASEYNTYGFSMKKQKIYNKSGEVIVVQGVDVKATDEIKEALQYNIAPKITLDKETMNFEIVQGQTSKQTLTATIANVSSEDLIWTVETINSGITISGTGNTRTIVVSKAIENAIIKVSYGNYSATCTVTVTEKTTAGKT